MDADDDGLLQLFSDEQARLISNNQVMTRQLEKQQELTGEIISWSKDLICTLHHLALIRLQITQTCGESLEELLKSQTLQGLKFSTFQYCPTGVDPSRINHYMYFIAFLRQHPDILSAIFYNFSKKHPERVKELAYSAFLSLFQHGWCVEEDFIMSLVLNRLADLQFVNDSPPSAPVSPAPPRKLLFALSDTECSLAQMQPFATFLSAYLFNGASLAYFQSSLAPIIVRLHGMSQLCDLRNSFESEPGGGMVAPFEYWQKICEYALKVYHSLMNCFALLPPGVFRVMQHLKELNASLKLIFFEGFINQALDNPVMLGLLPWHPSHGGWHPSRDIADVFRTRYLEELRSKHVSVLKLLLERYDVYKEIDLDVFMEKLCAVDPEKCSLMMHEAEILETNPGFPKELLLTGSFLSLIQEVALPEAENYPDLASHTQRLGNLSDSEKSLDEHFSLVVIRRKSDIQKYRKPRTISLFTSLPDLSSEKGDSSLVKRQSDPFFEMLGNLISGYPPFPSLARQFEEKSVYSFMKKLEILAPYVLENKSLFEAENVFWYVPFVADSEQDFVQRFVEMNKRKDTQVLAAVDRTALLRTHRVRIKDRLWTVQDIKNNVHSHIILRFADLFMETDMSGFMRETTATCHEHMTNLQLFTDTIHAMIKKARSALKARNVRNTLWPSIIKILFFRLTDHITFGRYCTAPVSIKQTREANGKKLSNWQRSVIVAQIITSHAQEMINSITEKGKDAWNDKMEYILRASDMLGHIRKRSGLSVILHAIITAVAIVRTLCQNCVDLSLDDCLVIMLLQAKMKHMLLINRLIHHFVLDTISHTSLQVIFPQEELNDLSVFPSVILMVLEKCQAYDARVKPEWARIDALK